MSGPGRDSRFNVTLRERVVGSLLGGALGDAWGGPFEGCRGPVTFAIPPNPIISDDTELTLATCRAILESRRVAPESVAEHFLRQHREQGIHGIGMSTLKAIRDLDAGAHWAVCGARGEYSAGNGAAMRIAPLAFLLDPDKGEDRMLIRDVSRITHHHDEAYAGALAIVAGIRSALSGEWPDRTTFLRAAAVMLPDCLVRDRIVEIEGMRGTPQEVSAKLGASGYVVDSVPLALLCAESARDVGLREVLERAIELGGDADTIASMAGQVAGAALGTDGIGAHIEQVGHANQIIETTQEFATFVCGETDWH